MSEHLEKNEDEVVKHLSWGAISFIEKPSSKVLAFAISSLTLGLILIFALSYFFKIELSVKVAGQINSIHGIKNAIAQRDGVIDQILVAADEVVKKDQVIAKLKIQGSSERELREIEKNVKKYLVLFKNKKLFKENISFWPTKINDSLLRSQFIDCQKKLINFFYLTSTGLQNTKSETGPLVARLSFLNMQLNKIKKSKYREQLLSQKYALTDEAERLKTQLASIENGMHLKLQDVELDVERSLENLLVSLDLFFEAHGIKAPIDGQVLRFHHFEGANIRANDTFSSLIPESSPLVAEVLVSSRDISKVKEGASVWVSIDAYPRNKYVYFKGKVLSLEKIKSSSNSHFLTEKEIGYLAKVSVDLENYKRNPANIKKNIQLIPGMKVDVQIVWKKTSIIGLLKSNFTGIEE